MLVLTSRVGEEREASQTTASLLALSLDEDLRLAERIKCALHATGYGALRVVEVSVTTRIVILVGIVPSYHLKQVAQATALAVPGADRIHNGLDVVRPS
jgi:osmotically-inducible protein OsmY